MLHDMVNPQTAVKKGNFLQLEIETVTSEVQENQLVLFGSATAGIKRTQKMAVWEKNAAVVNSVGAARGTPAKVSFNLSQ